MNAPALAATLKPHTSARRESDARLRLELAFPHLLLDALDEGGVARALPFRGREGEGAAIVHRRDTARVAEQRTERRLGGRCEAGLAGARGRQLDLALVLLSALSAVLESRRVDLEGDIDMRAAGEWEGMGRGFL